MGCRRFVVLTVFALLAANTGAQAATWPVPAVACLPERAAKWQDGKAETAQNSCHCPPTSMCPANYQEWTNPSLYKMTPTLVHQCCPEIAGPLCPKGTALANHPIPPDGNCNPVCPAGTKLAGQPVPKDGVCDPNTSCPTRHYTTMSQAGMTGDPSHFQFADGSSATFSDLSSNSDIHTKGLTEHYGWSVRVATANYWRYGPNYCGNSGGGFCPFRDFYSVATNGVNDGHKDLNTLVNSIGAGNLVWFGFSVAREDKLVDNAISQQALTEWGSESLKIAEHGVLTPPQRLCERTGEPCKQNTAQQFLPDWLVHEAYADDIPTMPKTTAEIGGFINQCFTAGGEFIEAEHLTINGNQCHYVQCHYIWDNGRESCLSENTKIGLADGSTKPVQSIAIGDVVQGPDGPHKVTALNHYQSGLRVLYGINGGGAMITGDHPIKTTGGWKVISEAAATADAKQPGFASGKLAVGDTIVTKDGNVQVTSIKRFAMVSPIGTYNLKVDGTEGFYANGIAVKGFERMEMHY